MTEAHLNFDEEVLKKDPKVYNLYTRLYEGMEQANQVTPPDFSTNPPLTPSGEIDVVAINTRIADYTTILMKNSAYLYASSIVASAGEGELTPIGGYLIRNGDSMTGALGALYNFSAGFGNKTVLDVGGRNGKGYVDVKGDLNVIGPASISDGLSLIGDLKFSNSVLVGLSNTGDLSITSPVSYFSGTIKATGIEIGKISINEAGIKIDGKEYYHSGNSNKKDVSWEMLDAKVNGVLNVTGSSSFGSTVTANNGFELGDNGKKIIYSVKTGDKEYIEVGATLNISSGGTLKVADSPVIFARSEKPNIISIATPGKVMNLGDSNDTQNTQYISLQTTIKDATGNIGIVSPYGDGNFVKSFKAGTGSEGSIVIETYYTNKDDNGVLFKKNIRLGSVGGAAINFLEEGQILNFVIPYKFMNDSNLQQTENVPVTFQHVLTTSPFRDLNKEWSSSLKIDTESEFIIFGKPAYAKQFVIDSDKYKTRLIENTLFLDDGIFIEGLKDGMSFTGNTYYSGLLSTPKFSDGFTGYGWAIRENKFSGGYGATFDSLTIRKKMHVFDLEVKKQSVTNGSFWVSNSCSGDMVVELS